MEVIECDRCKKRIGAKGTTEARATVKVKTESPPKHDGQLSSKVDKLLCSDCAGKLERFMAGEDDLRTVFQGVHPDTIKKVLLDVWRGTEDVDLDALSQKIIDALPNGGRF